MTNLTLFSDQRTTTTAIPRPMMPICAVPALLLAACLLPAGVLRAETTITGTQTSYTMSGAETDYMIAADAQVNNAVTSVIMQDNVDAVSRTLTNYGAIGYKSLDSIGATTPVVGLMFRNTGLTKLYNHGSIIMGDGATQGTAGARYAVRVNETAGALGAEIYNYGVIFGAHDAIQSTNAGPLKIVNTGAIIALNSRAAANWERAIYVSQAGPAPHIENSGLIRGGILGILFNNGSYRYPENFLITNSGTIEQTRTNVTPSLTASYGGIVIGRATVAGGSGTIVNTGVIQAYAAALHNTGTDVIVRNNGGRIESTNYYGILNHATSASPFIRIENNAGIIKGLQSAILINTGGALISNATGGVITGNTGITIATGGTILNSGTIQAASAGGFAIDFTNTGAVASQLVLDTDSVLVGDVRSAKAAGNSIVLQGSGIEDSSFIGADASGGFESLTMNGAAWTIGGTIAITGNAADSIAVNSGTLTLAGALVTPNNAGVTIGGGALVLAFTNDTVFGTDIAGSGALTHAGTGLLELTGNNTSTGITTVVNGGTLKTSRAFAGGLVLGGGATAGFYEYSGAGALTQNVTLAGAGGGFSVTSGTQTLAATVGGSGTFFKSGAGALDIRGATFGAIVAATGVNAGALIADKDSLVGDVNLAGAAASLVYDHAGADHTDNRAISGSGNFIKTGGGLLNLTGDITYTGNTIVEEGTLQGNIGSGGLQVDAGATYKVADGVTDFQLSGITGAGNVDLNAASLVFDVAVSGSFYFTGNLISSNTSSKLVKTGAGTLDLLSAVTLGGGVEVQGGTLRLENQNFVSTPIVLGTGTSTGLIEYTGAAAWARNVTIATGGAGGFSVAGGTQALGGAFTIQGAGTFVKAGAGALDVRNANFGADVAGTQVAGGTLIGDADHFAGNITLANNATLVYDQDTAATDNRDITGAGNLIKTGDSLLNLTGNNTYTGNTIVEEGTLQGNIGSGGLQVNANATYKVADGVTDFQLESITGGGNVDLNAANLLLDIADTGTFNFSGSLVGGSPASKLVKTGSGTLDLLSAVALDGGAEIREGTLRLAGQHYIHAPVVLGTGTTIGLIEYTGADAWAHNITLADGAGGGFTVTGGTQTLAGFTINGSGDFVKAGAGALDITGVTINDTGAGSIRVLDGALIGDASKFKSGGIELAAAASKIEFNETGDGAYAGAITGAGSLVKSGEGSLALTGANTYGDTVIKAGLLTGNVGVGSLTIERSGTYRVADGAGEFVFSGLQGNGILDLASADMVVSVDSGTSVFAFAGTLQGGNQFVKTGAGAVELQSAVALTAGARIEDGIVILADQSFLSAPVILGAETTAGLIRFNSAVAWTRAITLNGLGGGFDVTAGMTASISGAIQGSAAAQLIKTGAGTLDITSATLTGVAGAQVREGILRGNAATLPSAVETQAAGTVEFYERFDADYTGAITGGGAFAKTGDGTLTLTGSLANTGVTTISRGTLKLGTADVISPSAAFAIQSGGALDLGGFNRTVASLDNDGAVYLDASVNSRSGMVISSNTLSVTGGIAGAGKVLVRLDETDAGGGATSAIIMTSSGSIPFAAELASRVVEGPYDWALEKSGNGTSISLSRGMLSPEVAAAGGIDSSSWLVNRAAFSALGDRLMLERTIRRAKSFQVWAGWFHSEDTLDTDLYSDAKTKINGVQFGGEWNAGGKNGRPVFIGVFYDQATADLDFEGNIAESRTKTYGVGLYAAYRTRPLYAELILRNARADYEMQVDYSGRQLFKTDGTSMAASFEIGGVVSPGKTPWNVEPQLQLMYMRNSIDDTTDGMDRSVSVNSDDSIEGRAGVRLWRRFALVEKHLSFRPYVRGSLFYSTNAGGTVTVAGESFANKFGGRVTQFDGGFNLEWRGGFHLQANGAWYAGDKLDGYSLNIAAGMAW